MKAKSRNRYNQAPHLTQGTTRESGKNTIKHHTQESQELSPFPAAMKRQENKTNKKHKQQKWSTKDEPPCIEMVSKNTF